MTSYSPSSRSTIARPYLAQKRPRLPSARFCQRLKSSEVTRALLFAIRQSLPLPFTDFGEPESTQDSSLPYCSPDKTAPIYPLLRLPQGQCESETRDDPVVDRLQFNGLLLGVEQLTRSRPTFHREGLPEIHVFA
jgi:hypothetical protein